MGNSYGREDSFESTTGRTSRSGSILRRCRSLRHKSGSISRGSTLEDETYDSERENTKGCSGGGENNGTVSEAEKVQPKKLVEAKETEDDITECENEVFLTEDPPAPMTEDQKETVKRTWKMIEASVAKVGVVLFMGLFETHPDVQEVFIPFRGLNMEEVQQSKELRSHALRVMGFVEKAVRRLDEPDKLVPLIEECGKNHCHYGAHVQHVELVGPEFLRAIRPALEEEWTVEVEEAWALLLQYIAYIMKDAMLREAKRQQQQPKQ